MIIHYLQIDKLYVSTRKHSKLGFCNCIVSSKICRIWRRKTAEFFGFCSSPRISILMFGGWGVNSVAQHWKPGRTVRATVLQWPAARIYPVKRDGSGWFISLPLPGLQSTGRTNVRGVGLVRHWTALDLRVGATAGRLKLHQPTLRRWWFCWCREG